AWGKGDYSSERAAARQRAAIVSLLARRRSAMTATSDSDSQGGPGSTWGKQAAPTSEIAFLQGPQKRRFELFDAARMFLELVRGFRAFHFAGPCVTVFGSARFAEGHRHYELAR